jgi:hypothetical protein
MPPSAKSLAASLSFSVQTGLEQFHFEIALAAARADARREGISAIYLRCQTPERA